MVDREAIRTRWDTATGCWYDGWKYDVRFPSEDPSMYGVLDGQGNTVCADACEEVADAVAHAPADIAALLAALEEAEAALAADQRRTAAVLDVAEERIAKVEAERDAHADELREWMRRTDALRACLDTAEGLLRRVLDDVRDAGSVNATEQDESRLADTWSAARAFLADGPNTEAP